MLKKKVERKYKQTEEGDILVGPWNLDWSTKLRNPTDWLLIGQKKVGKTGDCLLIGGISFWAND